MCCAPFATDGDVTPLFLIISWKGVMFLFHCRVFKNSEAILYCHVFVRIHSCCADNSKIYDDYNIESNCRCKRCLIINVVKSVIGNR